MEMNERFIKCYDKANYRFSIKRLHIYTHQPIRTPMCVFMRMKRILHIIYYIRSIK